MRTENIFDAIAALLTYPGADYQARLAHALRIAQAQIAKPLAQFAEQVRELSTPEQEELFTRTFDLNPLCSLELGWHLFGENYDRGIMLVKMRELLRTHGIAENGELPDHMTHALALLARMDYESAEDFVAACVLPALEKMMGAMPGKNNPYENVLRALSLALHAEFPNIPLRPAAAAALPVLPEGVLS